MAEELPNGWVKTTLGEIVEPSRERALPREFPDDRYVGLEHIEPQTMRLLRHGYAREARSSSMRFAKGDVLYGKMRPYLNKVWVAEFGGLCSAEFLVFSKRDGLNSQFLATRLNAGDFVTYANGRVSGERPRVNFEKLSHFSINLPPVSEQERIAAKLNAAFSRVGRAEIAVGRARERLYRHRAEVLHAAVTGELTRDWRKAQKKRKTTSIETGRALLHRFLAARRVRWEETELKRLREKAKASKVNKWKAHYSEPTQPQTDDLPKLPGSWAWISIDQISWASGYGTSVKCTYEGDGPAVLRIPNIRNGVLNFEDLKFATSSKTFRDENFVAPGDLLLIRTNGSKDLIGRAAVVKASPKKKCSFASYLIRFRLIGDKAIWYWVSLAWQSDVLRSSLESRAATTAGQYNVSLSGLAGLAIPLPPPDEQTEIILEAERRLVAADRLASSLDRQLERSRSTRHSLLHEAFVGHLVPQDPNDEPASILLERLRAVRKVEAQKPKGKSMAKPKSKSKTARRPLLDVLREHRKPITPEQLFVESGYQQEFEVNECRQEVVDSFYEELRQLIGPKGPVIESRPNRNTVLLGLKS